MGTRSSLLLRRRSTRITWLPKRPLLRRPSLRRRSSPRSLDPTHMAHMAQLVHTVAATAVATDLPPMATDTHMAMVATIRSLVASLLEGCPDESTPSCSRSARLHSPLVFSCSD